MKPTLIISTSIFTLLTLTVICSHTANAQIANDLESRSAYEQPVRDNEIIRADFQQDTVQQIEQANHQLDELLKGGQQAGKSLTQEAGSANGLEFFTAQQGATWIDGIKHQAEQIDFPKVLGSLAIVVGGYLGFVWLTRRLVPGANQGLPQEVVEVIGQTPFGPKQSLQLVRLGSKLLLLMNGQEGTQTIGEITDPHEVEYLSSLCGGKKNGRSAIAIRKASTTGNKNMPTSDLKSVLRQLQHSADGNSSSSVFEA